MTPGLLKADRSAERFAGLPEGVEIARPAAGRLQGGSAAGSAFRRALVHAVDWLFRFTQPQDWEAGARPIVWPSASMQQEALGLPRRRSRRSTAR